MLSLIVLFCVSVVQADLITNNDLDDFVLNEILRNTRSEIQEIENWRLTLPLTNSISDDNFVNPSERLSFQKVLTRKKTGPLNMYRSRSPAIFKERVEKKSHMNNNNLQKFVLCHFKICNMPMGKRKTRFLHYWDMLSLH